MNFELIKKTLLWVAVFLVFVFLWVWRVYNSLIKKRNQVKTDLSDIQIQLERKASLADRLVGLVKDYSKHEKGTFKEVAEARSALDNSKNAKDVAQAENMITSALKSVMLVVESYPKVQASKNYQDVRSDLKEIEYSIAEKREQYNVSVQEFNNSIQTFPNLIISSILGFKEGVLFNSSKAV